jgi:hypothetical protein
MERARIRYRIYSYQAALHLEKHISHLPMPGTLGGTAQANVFLSFETSNNLKNVKAHLICFEVVFFFVHGFFSLLFLF